MSAIRRCIRQAPRWLTFILKRMSLKSYWMTLELESERTERQWTGTRVSQESRSLLSHSRTRLSSSALPEGTLAALPSSCFICCWMQCLHLLCLTLCPSLKLQGSKFPLCHVSLQVCFSRITVTGRPAAQFQNFSEAYRFKKQKKPAENNCFNPTNLISGYGPKGVLSWSSLSSKFFCISSNVVKYCRPLTVGIGTGPLKEETIL